ncbi:MAG: transporter substrate-binding domain-containing protein, partial [Deltaproteobacteria bacterium]|nr:transporter substrate-binding domain-containing protein [Deltaproteobacteria bacterium]
MIRIRTSRLVGWLISSLLLSLAMSMGLASPSFAEKDAISVSAESYSGYGREVADKIASITSRAIYNLDSDQLMAVIENYLDENRQIQSLQIVENVDQEVLLTYFRRDDRPVYNQPIPESLLNFEAFTATVLFESETIGTVTIHYVDAPSPPAGKKIVLTDDELAWIKLHPVIRVSSEPDYAPFDFIENGQPAGFSIDYLDLVARRAGVQLDYVQDTWDNLVKMGEKKEIDLLHTVFYTPERAVFFNFTKPYKSVVNVIYVREGI